MAKYYSGIGSRETPEDICKFMTRLAKKLAGEGWTMRSGAADGADTAFETGSNDVNENLTELYLPSPNYKGRTKAVLTEPSEEAYKIAEEFHPNWGACKPFVRKLLARDSHQVLGADLKTPSKFVVCWTPNASASGGTGQAIRIATRHNIPVYDLGDLEILARLTAWVFTGKKIDSLS
jgi:hypothetical protein